MLKIKNNIDNILETKCNFVNAKHVETHTMSFCHNFNIIVPEIISEILDKACKATAVVVSNQ